MNNTEATQGIQMVMNRQEIADTLSTILKTGVSILNKDKIESQDSVKIKLIRNLGPALNAAVSMVQQETVQQRMVLITSRMKQLGYVVPKEVPQTT